MKIRAPDLKEPPGSATADYSYSGTSVFPIKLHSDVLHTQP